MFKLTIKQLKKLFLSILLSLYTDEIRSRKNRSAADVNRQIAKVELNLVKKERRKN